jgi:hypothetical protein
MPRTRPIVRFALGACAMSALLAAPLPAMAQEASPAAAIGAACDAAPRDVEELIGFYFSPEGTPLPTPTMAAATAETELPTGEPADAETVAAVQVVLEEVFLCFENMQYARAFGLMTEDLARAVGPDLSNPAEDTPEELRAELEAQLASTPAAGAPLQMQLGEGRDVRVIEGGRVGGIWTVQGDAAFLVFAQENGQWLLDEIIDVMEAPASAGTPAP